MEIFLNFKKMISGCLAILLAPLSFQLFAADAFTQQEINASPYRLDLDWRFCHYAKQQGVPVCINPDAHGTEGLADVWYGVQIARKGWLEAADVLNTKTGSEMEGLLGL